MRPVRTSETNQVFSLAGAEDLPARIGAHAGSDRVVPVGDPGYHRPYVKTVWQPDNVERALIAGGSNVGLLILGQARVPALGLGITQEASPEQVPQPIPHGEAIVHLSMPEDVALDLHALLNALEDVRPPTTTEEKAETSRLLELRDLIACSIEQIAKLRDDGNVQ